MFRLILVLLKNFWKLPWIYLKLRRYALRREEYGEEEKYRFIQYTLNHVIKSGNLNLIVTGQEHIPQEGGFMLYPNHQGMFDCIAIVCSCDRPIGGVYKKELYKVGFIRYIGDATFSYAMDREDVRQSLTVIQNVTRDVKGGKPFLLFPEGTRSKKGNVMGEFHGGSFRCATKSGCPIVPVACIDCFKVLDQKGIGPLTVQLHYLEPIYAEEYQGMKPAELAELVKARIQAKIDECTK